MSDCRIGLKAPKPIHGQIVWRADQRPTPLSYARYVNGVERVADHIDFDGERYERVRECEFGVVKELIPGIKQRGDICECSNCGYRCPYGLIEDERFKCCPRCGARVKEGGYD